MANHHHQYHKITLKLSPPPPVLQDRKAERSSKRNTMEWEHFRRWGRVVTDYTKKGGTCLSPNSVPGSKSSLSSAPEQLGWPAVLRDTGTHTFPTPASLCMPLSQGFCKSKNWGNLAHWVCPSMTKPALSSISIPYSAFAPGLIRSYCDLGFRVKDEENYQLKHWLNSYVQQNNHNLEPSELPLWDK